MMTGKLCTLLMKKYSVVTETLRVFRAERTATAAAATKVEEEAATAAAHSKVIAEMVSPSQENNLTFPWFMTVHPDYGHVYFVECSSNDSRWTDPRQQGPSPIVHLSPVGVLSDLLCLVPPTVVWSDDQVQDMVQ